MRFLLNLLIVFSLPTFLIGCETTRSDATHHVYSKSEVDVQRLAELERQNAELRAEQARLRSAQYTASSTAYTSNAYTMKSSVYALPPVEVVYLPSPSRDQQFSIENVRFHQDDKTIRGFAEQLRNTLLSHGYEKVLIENSNNSWHFTTRLERIQDDGKIWPDSTERWNFYSYQKECKLGQFFNNFSTCLGRVFSTAKGTFRIYKLSVSNQEIPFDRTQEPNRKHFDLRHTTKATLLENKDHYHQQLDDTPLGPQWRLVIAVYQFNAMGPKKELNIKDYESTLTVCEHLSNTILPSEEKKSNPASMKDQLLIGGC